MTYATRDDLIARFGADELAQRESMLPAGALDQALLDADADINSYAATHYQLPLSPVPPNVRRVATVMARYFMLGPVADDRARNDFADVRAWLRDVQAGKVQLDALPIGGLAGSGAGTAGAVQGRVVQVSTPGVFGRRNRGRGHSC